MSQPPFFSIIIPTHNRADLLEQAIRSVLQQTFTDFELIVVDDHTTDETQIRLAGYDDPRLTYFLNDHSRGGAGARNAGIARAQGEWVAFLDDDDVWLPDKLAHQYDRIQKTADVGLVYTGYAIYDFARSLVLSEKKPARSGWIEQDLLLENVVGTFSTVAIQRDLLQAVGGLDERFLSRQDVDLYLRVAQLAPVDHVPQTLVYVRKGHVGRISMNWRNKLAGHQLFKQKYGALLQAEPRLIHRIDSRIIIYALLAHQWSILQDFSPGDLLRIVIDVRNYHWLLKEWGSSYLNRWRGQAG